jgi:hypothetical protein
MTKDRTVEGQNSNGEDGSPNQSLSSENGGSILDAEKLSQLLEAKLKPVLDEVRGVQGRQDKDRTAFREFLDEYNVHKAKGLSDDKAEIAATNSIKERSEAQSEKLLLRQIAEKLGLSSAGSGVTAKASIDVSQYGLDANDPEVVSAVLSQTDSKDAELAALKLAFKRQGTGQPSPSGAASLEAKPARPADVETHTKNYIKDMIAARGNATLLRQIKTEAIKNGVDVNNVVFS